MLLDKLAGSYQFGGLSSDWLLPLHSSIAADDQKKVFLRPPEKIRKVKFGQFNWLMDLPLVFVINVKLI